MNGNEIQSIESLSSSACTQARCTAAFNSSIVINNNIRFSGEVYVVLLRVPRTHDVVSMT